MSDYMDEYERNRKWLEDRDWDRHLWPEEATFIEAFDKGRAYERANAFGAIRRAAEYARYHERRAADWKRNGVQDLSDNCAFTADGIRRAIRAAIGSPKA